ncbi:MAG: metalloregulator ArsR/SmtB family transcription factor [Spirochaetota bacterium]
MDPLLRQKYETRATIMKALAHPSRLVMVEELEKGPRCVCELQQLVGADLSTVSKHLSVMKNAGLVYDIKQGTTVYYHLKTPCVLDFIGCVDRVIEFNAAHQVKIAQCCSKTKRIKL